MAQAMGEARTSDPRGLERPAGSWSKPFNFRRGCLCCIVFPLWRCPGLRGEADPARRAPGLLERVMQLGRYKSSHKARYFDLIFNELHQCYSSRVVAVPGEHLPGQMQCQQALGTYKSGEQDVRQSLPSLGVRGKASRGEGKGAALPPSVCLQVLSELTPWECRTSLTRGKTGHIQTLGVEGC